MYGEEIAIEVSMNYLPYARQDRICNSGEINGLKWILRLLDSMGVRKLTITDVHNPNGYEPSDYSMYIENISVSDILLKNIALIGNYNYIVSPDEGSRSKIYSIISRANKIFKTDESNPQVVKMMKELYQLEPINFIKDRDPQTGKINCIDICQFDREILLKDINTQNKKFLVVDDICDGGGTFIPISKKLNSEFGVKNIDLFVTHGIFSKGVWELLDHYDNIITTDSFFEENCEMTKEFAGRIKVIKL